MIERAHGLTDPALEAISDLERRVVARDGGRLKLEWGVLRSRPTDAVRDLLWWQGERLLGYLGIYGFNWQHLEVTGMVDPDARRRGIARDLFEAALPICREQDKARLLLVVPRNSPGGRGFALGQGMSYEHSEHALRLTARPSRASTNAKLRLRQATLEDIPVLSGLYRDGFGDDGHVDPERLSGERSRTLVLELDREPVGTVAIARDGAHASVHAFVVGAAWRGRGIGRDALRRVCAEQFDAGATHVDLEVEVENESALGLYTSLGFELRATEDYYELILA